MQPTGRQDFRHATAACLAFMGLGDTLCLCAGTARQSTQPGELPLSQVIGGILTCFLTFCCAAGGGALDVSAPELIPVWLDGTTSGALTSQVCSSLAAAPSKSGTEAPAVMHMAPLQSLRRRLLLYL